jgi:hypothetical protein
MGTTLVVITLISLVLAVAASTIAWRAVNESRRRSEARIAALARDIAGEVPIDGVEPPSRAIFADVQANTEESRAPLALAAGALMVGTAVALIIVLSSGERPSASTTAELPATVQAAARPLELVVLAHERAAGGLTVKGVVRNPTNGATVNDLAAVVLLMGPAGDVVSTVSTPVHGAALRPDDQATFLVNVPAAENVARYRVSFRAGDRTLVHVDKREDR